MDIELSSKGVPGVRVATPAAGLVAPLDLGCLSRGEFRRVATLAAVVVLAVAGRAQFPVVLTVAGVLAPLDQGMLGLPRLPALLADARLRVMGEQVDVDGDV